MNTSTAMPDAHWFKSSYSAPTDDNCVETAGLVGDVVGVRDSKDLTKGHLAMSRASWVALTAAVKR